jgi:ABC-type multidrug transport system fused ATPase/permease subunit
MQSPEEAMNRTTAAPPARDPVSLRVERAADASASPEPGAPIDSLSPKSRPATDTVVELMDVSFYYGAFRAVKDISITVPERRITALIGPSGCGKSTLLRTINRMNDLIPGTRLEGRMLYHGQDLYARDVDPVEVRRRIGMVYRLRPPHQRPQGEPRRPRRVVPPTGRPVGRSQGQAQAVGAGPVGRPAAAAVHRARHRHGT